MTDILTEAEIHTILIEVYGYDNAEVSDSFNKSLKLAAQKGYEKCALEKLRNEFIVEKHIPRKEECCSICGEKPTEIIHVNCAMRKGIITTEMAKKLEEAEQRGKNEMKSNIKKILIALSTEKKGEPTIVKLKDILDALNGKVK